MSGKRTDGTQDEKQMAMLNQWVNLSKELAVGGILKRPKPFEIYKITSISTCEKWRLNVMEDISEKITDIQNAGLGEHKIRDLNDEINKLLREKSLWEDRIRQLGGADYKIITPKIVDDQGIIVPGTTGYRYFGAAKYLPGVRELIIKPAPSAPGKDPKLLESRVGAEYFFYEETEEMLEEEREEERKLREGLNI